MQELRECYREIRDEIQSISFDKEDWEVIEWIARIGLACIALTTVVFTVAIALFIPSVSLIVVPVGVVATISFLITLFFTFV